ncbi:MFS transporter [Mycobacterium alsense]|uniref:Putative proline/betaine transporter n=1 Tax=Mycobacterium alsense TaxID=324058 RepID=A0ABD6NX09_9MYCO|nr:MFS transporter [Mycobacterium alsense]OBG33178.1 MFS transporter [Mycobacterium alsense]
MKRGRRGRRGGQAPDHITVVDARATKRSIQGTAIGNFMEAYDFTLFSLVATILAQKFYPGENSEAGNLIATFGTMTAGFVVRPLGGFIFGPLGDRIGRKPVLVMTISLMAVCASVTGVLPVYHTIGVWAPILLTVVRICQGLSSGGEYAGAMTYIAEHAPDHKRGMLGGFLPVGTLAGFVVGAALVTALQTALSTNDMLAWGWRVPFLLAAPLGLIALYLRSRIEESPDYEEMRAAREPTSGRKQFVQTVVRQWKPLLICMGVELAVTDTSYMVSGYVPTYLKKTASVGDRAALVMVLIVLAVLTVGVLFVAMLSDRVGVKPLMWTGCGLLIAVSIPAFTLMRFGEAYQTKFAGVLLVGLPMLFLSSLEPVMLPALFPTNVRYGAVSIGFNIAVSAFGGTTPLIAETLVAGTKNPMMPAYMLMFAGAIGAITLVFAPEVAGRPLLGSGPSVENPAEAGDLMRQRGSGGGSGGTPTEGADVGALPGGAGRTQPGAFDVSGGG